MKVLGYTDSPLRSQPSLRWESSLLSPGTEQAPEWTHHNHLKASVFLMDDCGVWALVNWFKKIELLQWARLRFIY